MSRGPTYGYDPVNMPSEAVFYELEYRQSKWSSTYNAGFSQSALYIFFISASLMILLSIPQTLTLFTIGVAVLLDKGSKSGFHMRNKSIAMILILLANISDHYIFGIIVLPGFGSTETITGVVWIFEIIWIILYGIEFLTSFKNQTIILPETQVQPATTKTEKAFSKFKFRLEGTKYEVSPFDEEIDNTLLEQSFRSLTQYIIVILVAIVVIDITLWSLISQLSGGNNIPEIYLVSGMSLFVFILLIIASNKLFEQENNSSKIREQNNWDS